MVGLTAFSIKTAVVCVKLWKTQSKNAKMGKRMKIAVQREKHVEWILLWTRENFIADSLSVCSSYKRTHNNSAQSGSS